MPIGEQISWAKLTERDVIKIRASPGLHKDIAEKYGVDRATVSRIKRGVDWKHLSLEGVVGLRVPKLTERDVLEIRAAVGFQKDIAKRYGVTQATVSAIKLRKKWARLT
jgi:transcriptional regulator